MKHVWGNEKTGEHIMTEKLIPTVFFNIVENKSTVFLGESPIAVDTVTGYIEQEEANKILEESDWKLLR